MVIFFIVLGIVVLVSLSYSILNFVIGKKFTKMLEKNEDDLFHGPKNMDLSFYENSPHKILAKDGREYMDQIESSKVTLKSFDDIDLVAFYFPAPNGNHKKVLLGMHGFKSNPRMEFAPYIKFYHSIGFDLILPFQRAHGESGGKICTMGVNERLDAVTWVNFIVEKFGADVQILMHGVSMGGATVCAAAGEDLPSQVIGVVSDCAYASIYDEIFFQQHKGLKNIPTFAINMCEKYSAKHLGFDFQTNSPQSQIENAKVPVLFVHGEQDGIVPVESTKQLYAVCSSKKQLLIVPNANHAESIGRDKDNYEKTIVEFFGL